MSTLNSGDMNIERSSTRVKAPPGGQSSIFFGEYQPEAPVTNRSRNHSKPTSSSDFYGNDNSAPQQQPASGRRASQQPSSSDIFGNGAVSDNTPRRVSQQPQPTLDVFGNDKNVYQEPPHSARRSLASPEKLDIYGRSEAPVQHPGKRPIQQPNSHIFDDNHTATEGGNRVRKHDHTASGIFDSNDGHATPVVNHRRPSAQSNSSGTDVFGNRQNEYREPTDYQTSSYQQAPPRGEQRQQNSNSRRGSSDTTQSLASCLSGGGVSDPYRQSRPNTGNSSSGVAGSMSGSNSTSSASSGTSRKHSNAGQSSLVLN